MKAYEIDRPCWPSVWKVLEAEKVFTEYIHQHTYETQYLPGSPGYHSREVIIKCALARVWEAGRLYQMERGHTK